MWKMLFAMGLLVVLPVGYATAGTSHRDTSGVSDPGRQAEAALSSAEDSFDAAREAYDKGNVDKGDEALEQMTKNLDVCVGLLQTAHKARFYKKAELRVAMLQRRMTGLLDDIALQQRGWAEQTNRKLDEIHDKLLAGVMSK
ncbi:MAG TPA: hypothetical protein VHZ55_16405 [Bryobacteraceae bacterium]|jgi:hypothetical protein|nr:hypothetical protein [Bryobacteraceae bacterium]